MQAYMTSGSQSKLADTVKGDVLQVMGLLLEHTPEVGRCCVSGMLWAEGCFTGCLLPAAGRHVRSACIQKLAGDSSHATCTCMPFAA